MILSNSQAMFGAASRDQGDKLFISKAHMDHTHKGRAVGSLTSRLDGAFSSFEHSHVL